MSNSGVPGIGEKWARRGMAPSSRTRRTASRMVSASWPGKPDDQIDADLVPGRSPLFPGSRVARSRSPGRTLGDRSSQEPAIHGFLAQVERPHAGPPEEPGEGFDRSPGRGRRSARGNSRPGPYSGRLRGWEPGALPCSARGRRHRTRNAASRSRPTDPRDLFDDRGRQPSVRNPR